MQGETVADSYPLSPMQQGMLFHSLYAQNCGVGIEQIIFNLHNNLNVSAFKQAWQKVAHRHPVLRTSFYWEGEGEPCIDATYRVSCRLSHRQVKIPLQQHDWRTMPAFEKLSPAAIGSRIRAPAKLPTQPIAHDALSSFPSERISRFMRLYLRSRLARTALLSHHT